MTVLAFLLIGLAAGVVARAVVPGTQAMGLLGTSVLGVLGSLLGGMLGSLINRDGDSLAVRPSGLILSVIGAIVVLGIAGFTTGNGARV